MRDRQLTACHSASPAPHPLTEARLEVVRASIRPNVDAVEVVEQLLEAEEEEPHVEDEVIVVLVTARLTRIRRFIL